MVTSVTIKYPLFPLISCTSSTVESPVSMYPINSWQHKGNLILLGYLSSNLITNQIFVRVLQWRHNNIISWTKGRSYFRGMGCMNTCDYQGDMRFINVGRKTANCKCFEFVLGSVLLRDSKLSKTPYSILSHFSIEFQKQITSSSVTWRPHEKGHYALRWPSRSQKLINQ